jgi:hypothetical protein
LPTAAQTGAYTLNGGTANLSHFTTNTSTADQCGIFVYHSGNLTLSSGATLILSPATNLVVGGSIIFDGAVTVVPAMADVPAGTSTSGQMPDATAGRLMGNLQFLLDMLTKHEPERGDYSASSSVWSTPQVIPKALSPAYREAG